MFTDADVAAMNSLNSEVNNLTSVLAASAAQEDAQRFNEAMQEDAQSWQLQLWGLQNMYNLPINQVARLFQAGLNPALVMGKGAVNNAAPVPNSPMASSGIGHVPSLQHVNTVLAAKQAELLDSQISVNESVKDKNMADAESSRATASLTDTRNRLETVQARIIESAEEALKDNEQINNRILRLEEAMKINQKDRDDIYTESFPERNQLELTRMRFDNRNVEREYALLGAQIDLAVAQGKLTRNQANEVALRCQILAVDKYIAQWEYNMARKLRVSVYGDADSPRTDSVAFQQLVEEAKGEIANRLSRCVTNEVILRNDYGFESMYGPQDRFYRYELKRRGANLERAQMYFGAIGAISGIAGALITRGASSRVAGAASRARQETDRQFGLSGNQDIQPDRLWDDF